MNEIPTLRSALAPRAFVERLDVAARRGRLPGFHADPGSGTFRVRLYGGNFDRMLEGSAAGAGSGSEATLRVRLLPGMPLAFVLISLFTVWPGVWLMDSMLLTYYPPAQNWIPTWWWYIPLTALPLPFAAKKLWRSSNEAATEDLRKTLASIARETDASPAR
ncbi:MAG: hypothetical protein IBJ10_10900 [Phycisphaerales bacterium]|nr:hypothetical protein [Phycisphaerales bacterium]